MSVASLFLVICFLPVYSGLRPEVRVPEGGNARLDCTCPVSEQPAERRVTWTDPKDLALLKVNQGNVEFQAPNVRTFEELHDSGNFSIEIQRVTTNHTGTYECYIDKVDSFSIFLNVTGVKKPEVLPRGGAALHLASWCASAMLSVGLLFI